MSIEPKKVSWDGTDIGSIDNSLSLNKKFEYEEQMSMWIDDDGMHKLWQVRIIKFKNDVPLILEEMKEYFGLERTGKHKGTYKGVECIIIDAEGDISLDLYLRNCIKNKKLPDTFIEKVRRIYVLRWVMCMTCNYETIIDIRTVGYKMYPVCYQEQNCVLNTEINKAKIPEKVIRKWFDNDYVIFDNYKIDFLKGKTPEQIKFKLMDIIKKYDPKLIPWTNNVYERVLHCM